jgi:hypothetical protein
MEFDQIRSTYLDNGLAGIGRIVAATPAILFFLLSPRTGFEDESLGKLYAFGGVVYLLFLVGVFLLLGVLL